MEKETTLHKPLTYYHKWRYKNTTFLAISLLVMYYFADSDAAHSLINHISNLGYLGALIAGILFVSIFTVAPSAVILFYIAESHNPLLVALLAGAGAVIGDYLIFRFLRDDVFNELHPLVNKLGGKRLAALFSSQYFSWLIPFIGALVIASPFPDEVGIGMLGLSRIKNWQFLFISYTLNTIGILLTVVIARAI